MMVTERPLVAQSGRWRNPHFRQPSILMGYARQVVVAVERCVSAATGYITAKKIIVSSVC